MIDNIMHQIEEFIQPAQSDTIRSRIMAGINAVRESREKPEQQETNEERTVVTQPVEPEVPDLEKEIPHEIKDYDLDLGGIREQSTLDGAIGETLRDEINRRVSDPLRTEGSKQEEDEMKTNLTEEMEGKRPITPLRTEDQANSMLFDFTKEHENPDEMGVVQTKTGELFTVFDVPGSPIGEKNIGWGIKVEPEMLGDDPKKWLTANGVPVDIRNGTTRDVMTTILHEKLAEARKSASKMPGWDKMLPMEKFFFNEIEYNGGPGSLKRSPKAMEAAKKGYTAEAAIKELDFIRSGGVPMRGLLIRRVHAYNKLAEELPGIPPIDEVEWGQEIKVHFSHPVKSTKVSRAYTNKINKTGDGWFKVTNGTKSLKYKKFKI
jgi:hypothetical protein